MNEETLKKFFQKYLDSVVTPKANVDLVGEDEEPITMDIFKVMYGINNPERINLFIDMNPDYGGGSYTNVIDRQLSNFKNILGLTDKTLHVYYNKRPLFEYEFPFSSD